jgi:hypothetical protein
MPRRRHHWFAHRPQLFMRRHRRRLSSTRRHRHRSFVRRRRSCVQRHHRWFMHHRPSRLFVRQPQRPTLRRCVESPDYRRAPSRHNQGVRPALKAQWGPLRVDFSPLPRRLRMAAVCALGPCTASSSHGGNPRAVTGASTRVVSLAKAPTDSMMRTTKLAPPVPLPPGKWWQAVDRQLFQFRRRRPSAQIMRRALCWCSRCCWCCSRWRSPHARRRRGARPSPLRLRSKLNQLDRFRRKRTLQTTLRMFQLARD